LISHSQLKGTAYFCCDSIEKLTMDKVTDILRLRFTQIRSFDLIQRINQLFD